MTTASQQHAIPTQYLLSPVSRPSAYISIRNATTEININLTANKTLALLLYTQTTSPDPAIDFKVCTVGPTADHQPPNHCFDQWGNNVTQAALQIDNDYAGQAWNRTWADLDGGGGGGWTLRSDFAGPARPLAVDTDGIDVVVEQGEGNGDGDANALRAFVDPAGVVTSASTLTSATKTNSISTTAASASASAGATEGRGEASRHKGLASGAIVGTVIGALAVLVILLSARQRRRKRRASGPRLPGVHDTATGGNELELGADEKTVREAPGKPLVAELKGDPPGHGSELEGNAAKMHRHLLRGGQVV
ncbi:uncharacterized protein HMPREF1541_10648 [Cyphellophora europaea CBS 101466]|uniref:Uncharacterized protein n=1 Tax=Cyphellophora europaea (strain CBS 101466) TaxID=1220924 RepID=W2S7S3_CYPE1|nr:uncharacterized protein HMPREF1541_10648 [Cyphellophora europaea CBS 101466]ETN44098.1 hypothetical protein HMPREF1541_10648 [Cyphellophora europaea CBS 101466]